MPFNKHTHKLLLKAVTSNGLSGHTSPQLIRTTQILCHHLGSPASVRTHRHTIAPRTALGSWTPTPHTLTHTSDLRQDPCLFRIPIGLSLQPEPEENSPEKQKKKRSARPYYTSRDVRHLRLSSTGDCDWPGWAAGLSTPRRRRRRRRRLRCPPLCRCSSAVYLIALHTDTRTLSLLWYRHRDHGAVSVLSRSWAGYNRRAPHSPKRAQPSQVSPKVRRARQQDKNVFFVCASSISAGFGSGDHRSQGVPRVQPNQIESSLALLLSSSVFELSKRKRTRTDRPPPHSCTCAPEEYLLEYIALGWS